jgi:hypothetical protein
MTRRTLDRLAFALALLLLLATASVLYSNNPILTRATALGKLRASSVGQAYTVISVSRITDVAPEPPVIGEEKSLKLVEFYILHETDANYRDCKSVLSRAVFHKTVENYMMPSDQRDYKYWFLDTNSLYDAWISAARGCVVTK